MKVWGGVQHRTTEEHYKIQHNAEAECEGNEWKAEISTYFSPTV